MAEFLRPFELTQEQELGSSLRRNDQNGGVAA
jgi:hypothetical protein